MEIAASHLAGTPRLPALLRPKRRATRRDFLRELAAAVPAESLTPLEAAAVMFGRLDVARHAGRRAWIRWLVEQTGVHALPPPRQNHDFYAPPRPVAILSRLNRSRCLFPSLVVPDPTLLDVKLVDIVAKIRSAHRRGEPWPRLLDVLVTSSGLEWSTAAAMLENIIGEKLLTEDILMVANARHFWYLFAEGRARIAALRRVGQAPVWQGDCAYFDRGQLADLLPKAVLPDHCQRTAFLARYIDGAEPPSVDLYDIAGEPICRHPFAIRRQSDLALVSR